MLYYRVMLLVNKENTAQLYKGMYVRSFSCIYFLNLLNRFSDSEEILSTFMEPKGSLPNAQVPATCPYPDPDRSSPCPHILLPEYLNTCIILPSTPGPSKWSLPSGFPSKTLYTPLISPHTCYMNRPSHSCLFDHPNNIGWSTGH
jgi:hypothetical protein